MVRLKLRDRFFLSHMVVIFVSIGTLIIASDLLASQYFSSILLSEYFTGYLRQMNLDQLEVMLLQQKLLNGFNAAWEYGAFWSVFCGAIVAAGVSYLAAQRIVRPLKQIERGVQRLANGFLDERLPGSTIPEINHLAASFNSMAAELEAVEQRRREMIMDFTHELRTPLTVVQGYLEGLADGAIAPSPNTYQLLARETKRLRRLVNDLQELSQAEIGYLPIRLQKLYLPPILEQLMQRFSDQLVNTDIYLKLDCPVDCPVVLADPERVEQILINLLGNAIRYAQASQITLRVWQGEQQLWLSVEDNGRGISPEDLPHIYERFWRSERSRSTHNSGTGIGLTIAKRLVELQKGAIEAKSEVGKGSTFQFSLPLT
ncbi:MAG TPA: HAMP domain-containing histidine kinase [Leptolyngbyaceae cyanobacterium M33_DOE_097]|uniref:histidine kinase n=1 Tax=Oscillatoriales cyanobacterium SpSt-418 TaxID=2282169 RepID=A0A7C3KEX9_9CYAN|nr:HAMP domain-containing histidine kinase [Leptolyngbyaceae cyanobacterium M33_DOE_097]